MSITYKTNPNIPIKRRIISPSQQAPQLLNHRTMPAFDSTSETTDYYNDNSSTNNNNNSSEQKKVDLKNQILKTRKSGDLIKIEISQSDETSSNSKARKKQSKNRPISRKRKRAIKEPSNGLSASQRPSHSNLLKKDKRKSKQISKTSSESEESQNENSQNKSSSKAIQHEKVRIQFDDDTEINIIQSDTQNLTQERNIYFDIQPNPNLFYLQNHQTKHYDSLDVNGQINAFYSKFLEKNANTDLPIRNLPNIKETANDSQIPDSPIIKEVNNDSQNNNSPNQKEATNDSNLDQSKSNASKSNQDIYPNFRDKLKTPVKLERCASINCTEDELRSLSRQQSLIFYANNATYDFPASFVPHYSLDKLKTMYVSFGLDTPPLYAKDDKIQSILNLLFPFLITLGCKSIPLSASISTQGKQFRTIQGDSFESMRAFKFFSEQLFPFEGDLNQLKQQLSKPNTDEQKGNMILESSIQLLPSLLKPYCLIDYENCPILNGKLTVKVNNTEFPESNVTLYRHFICIEHGPKNKISINFMPGHDSEVKLSELDENSSFSLTTFENCTTYQFKCQHGINLWWNTINDLMKNQSIRALKYHLFILSIYSHSSKTLLEQVIASVSSPFSLFSICLLSCTKFQPHICSLYNILKSEYSMDYYLKLIILSLFSSERFDHVFETHSIYSRALMNLFKSVSEKWLKSFILNLEKNEISNPTDLLNLIYSMFSLIDIDGFYILRALILYSFPICPGKSHPLTPFINFLLELVKTTSPETSVELFYSLKRFISIPLFIINNRQFYELVPFVNKIASIVPKIQGDPKDVDAQAEEIYAFLADKDNLEQLLPLFDSFADMDPSQRPIVQAFRQNISFLMRF